MTVSNEQERLEIIRHILNKQPFLSSVLPVHLAVDAEDADDCAVYDLPGNLSLLVGTDFVRGTGFTLFQEEYLSYFDLGYYLIIANLSDIAAMGGTPIGLTTVIRYPNSLDDGNFMRLVEGINEASSRYHTPVIGGDIGGYSETVLTATALGITEQGKYLRRRGTVEGDILCITGEVGLPSTALVYFTKAKKDGLQLSDTDEQVLLNSWRRPVARIQEGQFLAKTGSVHACQDISDGMKATIEQLGRASSISFEVYERCLPIHQITRRVAEFLHVNPIALAFSASVDFQLMFTVSQEEYSTVEKALQPLPSCNLHTVGRAILATEPSYLVGNDGRKYGIPGTTWNQQVQDVTQVILNENKLLELFA